MPAHHELRRSRRIATYIDVKWCRKGGDVEAKGTDINADGMFMETSEDVEPGTLMELRIQLPDRQLAVFATAIFVGRTAAGRGIGLEFYMMSSHTRLAWLTHYHLLLDHDAQSHAEQHLHPQPRAT
jgi:PilZ domain-containing protein